MVFATQTLLTAITGDMEPLSPDKAVAQEAEKKGRRATVKWVKGNPLALVRLVDGQLAGEIPISTVGPTARAAVSVCGNDRARQAAPDPTNCLCQSVYTKDYVPWSLQSKYEIKSATGKSLLATLPKGMTEVAWSKMVGQAVEQVQYHMGDERHALSVVVHY